MIPVELFAQTDSTNKTEPLVAEETSLISPSIDFISIQKGDNSIDLKAALKAKVKGTFYKFPLLKITFMQLTDTVEKELGFVITDRIGSAVFNCKANSVTTDKEGKLHFKAVFAGNKSMDPADAELTIKRARLEITPVKGDSLLTTNVKLVDVGTGKEIPVKDIVLGIFVQRSFFPLKIGEGTTGENGEASVEISNNLPGDAKGMITLLAKLDESELYGNLEASTTAKWGIPVSDILQEAPRSLWSAHPPVWMMVTFAVLMIIVWGHYIVIVYELFRLRKEEPHSQPVNQINT
ncbi:MAG: hypothetical protein ABIO79_17510 [Ferruginibacter sp.]